MQTLTGNAIFAGFASGAAHISASFSASSDAPCRGAEAELARFTAAVAAADAELAALAASARQEAGEDAAILARSLGIPTLVCPDWTPDELTEGMRVLVLDDTLILAPTPEALADYEAKAGENAQRQRELAALAAAPAVTRDGRRVALYANIGGAEDIPAALEAGAEGIGLFRSEFLFLGRDSLPDEEEQLAVYRKVLEAMGGRPVTVRGELAADRSLTERFLALGIDELSAASPHLLPLRAHIRALAE